MPTQTVETAVPKIIQTLNRCIEACIDGEKGYAAAAADVRDPALKTLLHGYSMQRAAFVGSLQASIDRLGGFPENHGTARGTAHRGFLGARIALEGRTDAVILGECERGETGAISAYDHAFARTPLDTLPTDVRALLTDQYAAIKTALDAISGQDISRRRSAVSEKAGSTVS